MGWTCRSWTRAYNEVKSTEGKNIRDAGDIMTVILRCHAISRKVFLMPTLWPVINKSYDGKFMLTGKVDEILESELR
ncbi:hypothetical protein PoB_000880900 [Plakobranchus ocellatus]|uniref:Uncharacterized protein n=1 Tax=Plakobranchus ocellatus TaxID=259542 RepID=A0AAV3YH22_9GAST|nr:hypothetical protein PoB_000880900 [Plakobranchus ocellatus]